MHTLQQHGLWTARLSGISAVLCTATHFSQREAPKKGIPFHFIHGVQKHSIWPLRKTHCQQLHMELHMRQAVTLLHPDKSRYLVRETAHGSSLNGAAGRHRARVQLAVIDVYFVCFVTLSMIFLKKKLQWSDWHVSCAVSIISNGSCTAQLFQTH